MAVRDREPRAIAIIYPRGQVGKGVGHKGEKVFSAQGMKSTFMRFLSDDHESRGPVAVD